MGVFTAPISGAFATTNPQDLVSLLSTALSKVRIKSLELFALTTNSAAGLGVGIELWRTTSSSAANGAAITPTPIEGKLSAPFPATAVSAVNGPSSAILSTAGANAQQLYQGALTLDGFCFAPCECAQPTIDNDGQRFHARITAPSTALTIVGTLTFEEYGRTPGA